MFIHLLRRVHALQAAHDTAPNAAIIVRSWLRFHGDIMLPVLLNRKVKTKILTEKEDKKTEGEERKQWGKKNTKIK